jgi:hypothetical protein
MCSYVRSVLILTIFLMCGRARWELLSTDLETCWYVGITCKNPLIVVTSLINVTCVQMLTIVASETILCLPVATLGLRDALINRFQSFVEYFRSSNPANEVFTKRKHFVDTSMLGDADGIADAQASSPTGGRASVALATVDDGTRSASLALSFSSLRGGSFGGNNSREHSLVLSNVLATSAGSSAGSVASGGGGGGGHPHPHKMTLFPIATEGRFSEPGNGMEDGSLARKKSASPKASPRDSLGGNPASANANGKFQDEFDMMDLFDAGRDSTNSRSSAQSQQAALSAAVGYSNMGQYSPPPPQTQMNGQTNGNNNGLRSMSTGSHPSYHQQDFVRSAIGVQGVTAALTKKRKSLTGSVITSYQQQQQQQQHQQLASSEPGGAHTNNDGNNGRTKLTGAGVASAMSLRSVSMVRRSITGMSNMSIGSGSNHSQTGSGLSLTGHHTASLSPHVSEQGLATSI